MPALSSPVRSYESLCFGPSAPRCMLKRPNAPWYAVVALCSLTDRAGAMPSPTYRAGAGQRALVSCAKLSWLCWSRRWRQKLRYNIQSAETSWAEAGIICRLHDRPASYYMGCLLMIREHVFLWL
ncbi:hypothetical protein NDU88_004622 [Pleurodeles waltl]|uniref:Uncharacterized protein n=1 Tax=Pleurodeles waltl TaxID=8319 RepID=A0AAV7T7Y2_PLEWA|nr:hypothetical protein NDU88_004622 [Pleurodeles waltl]